MKESIIFAGYRDWALELYDRVREKNVSFNWYLAESPEQLSDLSQIDSACMIILAGWSWILPKEIVSSSLVLGLHPSDLPDYAGGSPIQNQVLDGLTSTKMTLFKLNEKIDAGDVLYKETLNLVGGIRDIFHEMVGCGEAVIDKLLVDYPDLVYIAQEESGKKCFRIQPDQSRLQRDDINNMSVRDLYNFIRCREDPYPNAFLEDASGKLLFKGVEFVSSDD